MNHAEDPRELAKRLAEDARAKTAAASGDAKAPRSRTARLAKATPKAMSAQEALKAAIEAEQAATDHKADAARAKARARKKADAEAKAALERAEAAKAAATRPRKEEDPTSEEAPAAKVAAVRPSAQPAVTSPGELLTKRLPAFQAERILTIERREAFRGVWSAHRTRAGVEQDAAMLATADMLLDAARRLPPRAFHAARVASEDGTAWAVFIDTASGTLLAAVAPADVYLVGLR